MESSDASVLTYGVFCVMLPFALVATFWRMSADNSEDEQRATDRVRATLSQFTPKMVCGYDTGPARRSFKWAALGYEFVQVRASVVHVLEFGALTHLF